MSIKAVFLLGQTEITVNGLHQWDYGQQLEIHAQDLPALVEVHFACIGMKEAAVRPCSVVEGVGAVTIPDACLEQSAPITAWIYEINGSTGTTVKTIVLKVTERARPATGDDIPVEVADKYTEAVTAMNEQVQALKDGEVVVKKALQADKATEAGKATEADSAAKISVPDHGEVEGSYLIDVKNGEQAVPVAKRLNLNGCQFGRELLWQGKTEVKKNAINYIYGAFDNAFLVIEFEGYSTLNNSSEPVIRARTNPRASAYRNGISLHNIIDVDDLRFSVTYSPSQNGLECRRYDDKDSTLYITAIYKEL